MKKAISILMCVLLSLTILYPAGVVITACFGYGFKLISISAFAIVLAVLSVCIVVLDLICKNTLLRKADSYCFNKSPNFASKKKRYSGCSDACSYSVIVVSFSQFFIFGESSL